MRFSFDRNRFEVSRSNRLGVRAVMLRVPWPRRRNHGYPLRNQRKSMRRLICRPERENINSVSVGINITYVASVLFEFVSFVSEVPKVVQKLFVDAKDRMDVKVLVHSL